MKYYLLPLEPSRIQSLRAGKIVQISNPHDEDPILEYCTQNHAL
jgi:hypothetical protein